MERGSNNSFVIFRFGEDNSENVMLSLPNVLMNNDSTNAASNLPLSASNTQPSPSSAPPSLGSDSQSTHNANIANTSTSNQDTTTADESRAGNESTSNNPMDNTHGVPEEHIERNMIVSVSYVYSGNGPNNRPQTGVDTGATGGINTGAEGDQTRDDRTGSILLNVPNIPNNRNESQLNALIEFAASLALSAIAANLRRNNGIKKETFEKLKIKSKKEVQDKTCAICYDEYIDEEATKGKECLNTKVEGQDEALTGRKRRASNDGTEERQDQSRKVRRTETVTNPTAASNESSTNQTPSSTSTLPSSTEQPSNQEKKEEYKHVPLVLPCDHYFGRSCIYEWLRSNSTCPLCRQPITEDGANDHRPLEQINIPNIGSLLNPSTRDHPMIIVLDRATNTLIRRHEEPSDNSSASTALAVPQVDANTPEAAATQSILSALTQPRGVPLSGVSPPRRDPFSASILRGLNQPRFPGLFSSGVSSRRTETGVETVNLDNDGLTRNDFDNTFYDESRRLIEERLRARHLRDANAGSSSNTNTESIESASNETGITTPTTTSHSQSEQTQSNENNRTSDTPPNA